LQASDGKGIVIEIRNRKGVVLLTVRDADLYGVNLRGANLRGADLYGADLYGANLRGADLRDADLRDADLRGANVYGANLYGVKITASNALDLIAAIGVKVQNEPMPANVADAAEAAREREG